MSARMADAGNASWEQLPLPGAELRCAWSWLSQEAADALFEQLLQDIPWERHRLHMFGRELDAPRLNCWIGDPGAVYTYSRTRFEPRPWTPALQALRERVERSCHSRFNSVLANLYRDGADSMGWHSDDEPELGPQPVIASLSLGATRRFRLRPRRPHGTRAAAADTLGLPLTHGSLLCMSGATQHLYQHDLPRSARVGGPRINLTFRLIHARAGRPP
jgi:alkylated DNA repair dioxygenase AlkB